MQMVYFKENYNFPRFQTGFNIFPGGGGDPTFSRRIQLLIPYRLPYNLCFSSGVRVPCPTPPKDQRMQYFDQLDDVTKVRYEKKLSILTPPPPWVSLNVYMVSGKTTIVACPGSKLFFQVLKIWGDRGSGPPLKITKI